MKRRLPREMTESELRGYPVTLVTEGRTTLCCDMCGCVFSPNIQEGGRLPDGWWKCPECAGTGNRLASGHNSQRRHKVSDEE